MYQQFKAIHMFVGKTNTGSFNDVAPDMKLEQTIQRSKKGAGGIIGQTKRSPFVSERELVYHEILGISNSFSEIIKPGKLSDIDLNLHHELSGGYRYKKYKMGTKNSHIY